MLRRQEGKQNDAVTLRWQNGSSASTDGLHVRVSAYKSPLRTFLIWVPNTFPDETRSQGDHMHGFSAQGSSALIQWQIVSRFKTL